MRQIEFHKVGTHRRVPFKSALAYKRQIDTERKAALAELGGLRPGVGYLSMAALIAFYDAKVLYPAELRNFLMHLALTGLFRAKWSAAVHEEWISNLLKNRPDLTRDKLEGHSAADWIKRRSTHS